MIERSLFWSFAFLLLFPYSFLHLSMRSITLISATILSLHLLVPNPPSSKKANVANAWSQHCLSKWITKWFQKRKNEYLFLSIWGLLSPLNPSPPNLRRNKASHSENEHKSGFSKCILIGNFLHLP